MYIDHYIMSGKKGDRCQIIAPKELATYLKKLREEKDYSQSAAAQMSRSGIPQTQISILERAQLKYIQWDSYVKLKRYVWWLEEKKAVVDITTSLDPVAKEYKEMFERQSEITDETARLEYSRGRIDGMLTVVVSALFGALLGFILVQLF